MINYMLTKSLGKSKNSYILFVFNAFYLFLLPTAMFASLSHSPATFQNRTWQDTPPNDHIRK